VAVSSQDGARRRLIVQIVDMAASLQWQVQHPMRL
jgi:hypothetical protein